MSRSRIRVAVLGGGQSCEHEVSLASAASVANALDRSRYDALRLTITLDGEWLFGGEKVGLHGAVSVLRTCDVVLPMVHGPRGEDGTLAALCELAGVAYIGSGVSAGAVAMDKWATKALAAAHGIVTAPAVLLTARDPAPTWTGPVVVKPVAAGSSRGVSLVEQEAQLADALTLAFSLDRRVLVEDVVHGREIDVAVLGTADGEVRVSPALEIIGDGIFDYEAKYAASPDFRVPADLAPSELHALQDAAEVMFRAVGCAGVARVDFFLTDDGPVLNEVNTMPGMTEHSQVPKMFAADGTSYSTLLDALIGSVLALD